MSAAVLQGLGVETKPGAVMTTRAKRQVHVATARALETWAAQKRLLFRSDEGFAPRSIIAKIREEREGAGEGRRFGQRFLEVYTGDGAIVQRIARSMPEVPRAVLSGYYLLRKEWYVSAGEQATHFGIALRTYWAQLEVAESVVDSGLRLLENFAEGDA